MYICGKFYSLQMPMKVRLYWKKAKDPHGDEESVSAFPLWRRWAVVQGLAPWRMGNCWVGVEVQSMGLW